MTPEQNTQQLPANHPSLRAGRIAPSNFESTGAQRRAAAENDLELWFEALRVRANLSLEIFAAEIAEGSLNLGKIRMCNYLPRGQDQELLIRELVNSIEWFTHDAFQANDHSHWDISLLNEDGEIIEEVRGGAYGPRSRRPMQLALDTLLRYHQNDDAPPWIQLVTSEQVPTICGEILSNLGDPVILSVVRRDENELEVGLWYPRYARPLPAYMKASVKISASNFVSEDGRSRLERCQEIAEEAARSEARLSELAQRAQTEIDDILMDDDIDIGLAPEGEGWGSALANEIHHLLTLYTTNR